MLGSPTIVTTPTKDLLDVSSTNVGKGENEGGFTTQPQTMPQQATMQMPQAMSTQAFVMPTPTQVQNTSYTSIPQKKNTSVKILLFVIMFVGLGFTTFFILKTMYPIEFGNIFGGGIIQTGAEIITTDSTSTDFS